MRPAYLIILIVLNFFWAASLSAYKVIEQFLEPGGIVTLRFGLAALSLLVFWPWFSGAVPRGWELFKTVLMGLIVFTLGHRLQVWGNKLSTAANSSVLIAVEPLISAVAAAIFLREHLGPRRLIGFTFGMLGVVLLNGVWRPDFQWASLGASLLFVASLFAEITYSILGKKIINANASRGQPHEAQPDAASDSLSPPERGEGWGEGTLAAKPDTSSPRPSPPSGEERESVKIVGGCNQPQVGPLKVLTLALVAGTLANLLIDGPTTFAAAGRMSGQAWWLILGLAVICTAAGYSFWFMVIREGEVNVAALTLFAQPVFGVALAKLWLNETLHWGQLWGSVAIVVGLVIGLSRQIKPPGASGPAHSG